MLVTRDLKKQVAAKPKFQTREVLDRTLVMSQGRTEMLGTAKMMTVARLVGEHMDLQHRLREARRAPPACPSAPRSRSGAQGALPLPRCGAPEWTSACRPLRARARFEGALSELFSLESYFAFSLPNTVSLHPLLTIWCGYHSVSPSSLLSVSDARPRG